MRVLCIGDVFAPAGVNALMGTLGRVKRDKKIDLCIVNGENAAPGNGMTRESCELIFSAGADIITGGNHSLRHEEFLPYLDGNPCVLRPHNIKSDFGGGYVLYDMGKFSAAVINLSGQIYLEKLAAENPFTAADLLISRARADGAKFIFVDFHAEATSEKRALGFYLDGKITALFGTHTHVQTADAQVLPKGSGYITDLGMTGVKNSVLGVKSEIIIERMRVKDMSKFVPAQGDCQICGCIFDADEQTGLCTGAETIYINEKERAI